MYRNFWVFLPHMFAGKILSITVTVAVITMSIATAQEKMSLKFLAFPKMRGSEPVELVVGENKTIEVATPGHELSPEYKVAAQDTIVVGKTIVNEEGEPEFQVYGRAKSNGSSNQIILLMRKGRENSDGFDVVPINGNLDDFKGGNYIFINASKLNVGGVMGETKFALKPGQQRMLKPKPDHENNVCQVTLSYEREDGWKKFKDTRWPTNERYRSLIFFHQDPRNGRIGVSPIVDMLPYESSDDE